MSNARRQVFIAEYLKCWNSSEAARRAGYNGKSNVIGPRLLANVSIRAEIDARLAEIQMSADEALVILAEQARGDPAEFMDITTTGFNLRLLDQDGNRLNTRLIRKIKQKTTTYLSKKEDDEDREVHEIEIELYDAQSAIDKILRVAGKYKDSLDISAKFILWDIPTPQPSDSQTS
jgi:hypothetical protein